MLKLRIYNNLRLMVLIISGITCVCILSISCFASDMVINKKLYSRKHDLNGIHISILKSDANNSEDNIPKHKQTDNNIFYESIDGINVDFQSYNDTLTARQRLLTKFAPRLLLHPRDKWRPADPRDIYNVSDMLETDDEDKYISVPFEFLHGNPVDMSKAKVYAPTVGQVIKEGLSKVSYLQYWFYYPVNGCQGFKIGLWTGLNSFIDERTQNFEWCGMAFHYGDWEHITIKLNRLWDGSIEDIEGVGDNKPLEVKWVAFSQHAGSQWVKANKVKFLEDTHPVVYAGMNSHANYPFSGTHKNPDDTFDFVSRISPVLSFGSVQTIQIVDVADLMNDLFLYDEPQDGNVQRFISWDTWNEPVLDITDDSIPLSHAHNLIKDENGHYPPQYAGVEDWALFDGSWGDSYDQTLIIPPPVGVQAGKQLHMATTAAEKLGILNKFVRKNEMGPKGPRSHRVYYTLDYPPIF